jgi:hypothetical protein
MAITLTNRETGHDLQQQIAAVSAAVTAAGSSTAAQAHARLLTQLQTQLVYTLMGSGRINPATVISTLS